MLPFEFKFKTWNWSRQEKQLLPYNETGLINREQFSAITRGALLTDNISTAKKYMTFKQTFRWRAFIKNQFKSLKPTVWNYSSFFQQYTLINKSIHASRKAVLSMPISHQPSKSSIKANCFLNIQLICFHLTSNLRHEFDRIRKND